MGGGGGGGGGGGPRARLATAADPLPPNQRTHARARACSPPAAAPTPPSTPPLRPSWTVREEGGGDVCWAWACSAGAVDASPAAPASPALPTTVTPLLQARLPTSGHPTLARLSPRSSTPGAGAPSTLRPGTTPSAGTSTTTLCACWRSARGRRCPTVCAPSTGEGWGVGEKGCKRRRNLAQAARAPLTPSHPSLCREDRPTPWREHAGGGDARPRADVVQEPSAPTYTPPGARARAKQVAHPREP